MFMILMQTDDGRWLHVHSHDRIEESRAVLNEMQRGPDTNRRFRIVQLIEES